MSDTIALTRAEYQDLIDARDHRPSAALPHRPWAGQPRATDEPPIRPEDGRAQHLNVLLRRVVQVADDARPS